MCASRVLIMGLVTFIEIVSAQIPPRRQAHLRSPYHGYPDVPGPPAGDGKTRSSQIYAPPKANFKSTKVPITRTPQSPRYRHKKINQWIDPINYKKAAGPKRPNHDGRPQQVHSTDEWNDQERHMKKSEYSDLPSEYLEPPKWDNSEYNYYIKDKKPSTHDSKKGKTKEVVEFPENHRLPSEEESTENNRPTYTRDHAPKLQVESKEDVKTTKDEPELNHENVIGSPISPKDRIEFQIHGHDGPQTYIFGYDTGNGKNRQFRLEERHGDGSITGQYGYVDARGKLRKVRYKASPTEGYVEKHHETKEHEQV